MKHLKNLLAYVLVFALVLFNIPANIFADENNNVDLGTVRVIIRNTTFPKANGAKWDGVLLDKKVELKNDSNAMSVIADAVKSENLTITGVETNYVTEIAGLSAYDGGSMSGFMGTVNDWFANEGLDAFKVSNGKLVAGDEVCMEYSCAWGGDIGSVWNDNSTELTELTFSAGILNEEFQPATKEYTLSIPKDVTSVTVTSVAKNKNFQVRTYKNTYTPTENGSEIKRNTEIPVTEGDKLYIGVGDTSWPSMNSGQTASKYTVNIVYQEEVKPDPDFEKFELSAYSLNGWTSGETFDKETASYDIQIKNYSTSTISTSSATTYDEDKFTAVAKYTDSNQEAREIEIKNKRMTSLNKLSFGNTQIIIEISDKTDAANKKQYTLNVFRPYDTTASQSVKITDESGKETEIVLEADKQEYQVAINDSKNIRISLNGAQAEDNIFVDNKKITADESADITVGDNGKTVQVLIQNDEKEPVVFIFHITSSSEEKTQHIFEETTKSLLAGETPVVASIGGEWVVTGLARAGKISDEFKTGYFKNVYDTVKANGTEKLSNTKSTDNSRVILALTSLGYDVTDIAGQNLLKPLSDYEYVTKQGVNGAIYALLALDSAKYEIPENTYDTIQTTRENLIQNILAYKLENSGFSFDGETADVDITAMALQALAPYADTYVSEIEDAVSYLSSAQNEDGSYGYQGTSNTESTAQVVLALTTNNINPRTDDRFIKNGTSAYTALLNFFVEDGFAHEFAGERNQMSTEQAYLGLVSYIRYQNTEDTIYDMSKVEKSENIVYPDEQPKNPDDNKPDDKKSDDKKSDDKKLDDKKSDDKKSDDKKSDDKKTNNKKSDDKSSVKQSTDNQSVAKADNTSAAKNPKTGDNNAALLFVTIMLISATTIISARKKKNV